MQRASHQCRYLAQAYDLQIRELPVKSPEFTIGLAWQQALDRDPFTQWFINLVESLLTGLRESEGWAVFSCS
ncbi:MULTISPECIES: hypothetical protein [Pseudomonas syringae group]|uniref:hypothetical protein n=1 Tax=Pseudomonas syringae group TaxID=136849 RepID=UPI0003FF9C12|nr:MULTISPECIES: hypothetical protein [Pseudomonas syringae group]RMV74158.1 hypothetical protein ALP06_01112 [Pseudomonas coronafaciens pv. atropurpurea]